MAEIMTMEERAAKIAEAKNEAQKLAEQYNEEMQSNNLEAATITDGKLAEKIKEYNSLSKTQCFVECKANADGPLLAAIKKLYYPIIKKKDEKIPETVLKKRVIVEMNAVIDIKALHEYCDKKTGVDPAWVDMADKLYAELVADVGDKVGFDASVIWDTINVRKAVMAVDLGKNPVSQTHLIKTMNAISMAMVGEGFKFRKEDANKVREIFATADKKDDLAVKTMKIKEFYKYFAVSLNAAINDLKYKVTFEQKKQKTA